MTKESNNIETKRFSNSIVNKSKENLYPRTIDLDVDHLQTNLKNSNKILQEMKQNLAKEVKITLFHILTNFFLSRKNIRAI